MRRALCMVGLLVSLASLSASACARVGETTVRERAGAEFACADYAMTVVEVGPDVYRASGCGQELVYACRPSRPSPTDDPGDVGDDTVMVCARTVQ